MLLKNNSPYPVEAKTLEYHFYVEDVLVASGHVEEIYAPVNREATVSLPVDLKPLIFNVLIEAVKSAITEGKGRLLGKWKSRSSNKTIRHNNPYHSYNTVRGKRIC